MNQELSKAIMTRSRLRNKFLKNRTIENKRKYTKQRNYCVHLLRKSKKDYYGNLNEKSVTDNRTFWKTVKPFLSDKVTSQSKITLIEKEEILSDEADVAETLNNFFTNVVTNLRLPQYNSEYVIDMSSENAISSIVDKYKDHPSISAIKNNFAGRSFSFEIIDIDV